MNRKGFSIILIVFLLTAFFIPLLKVDAEIVDTNNEANPIQIATQKNSFIYLGVAYVFYVNGTYLNYKYRTNGTSWGSEYAIRTCTDGKDFSIWFEERNNIGYVHYVYTDYTNNFYYRRGTLIYGNITWSASEQTIPQLNSDYHWEYPFVCADSEGYPVISADYFFDGTGQDHWKNVVYFSDANDGTWNDWFSTTSVHTYTTDGNKRFRSIQLIPMQNRGVWVLWNAGNLNPKLSDFHLNYWNGTAWEGDWTVADSDAPTPYFWAKWGAVSNSDNELHVICSEYEVVGGDHYFHSHSKWIAGNGVEGWEKIHDDTYYNWTTDVRPVISIDTLTDNIYTFWEEYPDADNIYSCMFNETTGTYPDSPRVWYASGGNITEDEDFSSVYQSDTDGNIGVSFLTTNSSNNVEFEYSLPLQPLATYDITTYIRINGYEPYTNVTFQINSETYANGQTATLDAGANILDGTPVTHLSFINWTITGSLGVLDSSDPTTTLIASGTGTLTLHLNATVDITHDSTTITNMNADTWVFAEYKFYAFQSQYTMTNSYIDTVQWSFLDFATHNITFYYNNATTEAVLYGADYIALRNNASYSYSWLNLTDQTFIVTVWVWIKINIIDTLYVDLYVQGNCSGYGLTNSTGGWEMAQSEYFNIYSQGGAEELTIGVVTGGMVEDSSVAAGRSLGGDIFNLYAYNDTFALSEQYWRKLVHVKVLFEFKWDYGYAGGYPWDSPSADFPIDLHYQLGWTYYARGNWSINRFSRIDLKLEGFGYGADHQFSKWDIKIVHGGVEVYDDTLFGWFDEDADSYKVWLDLWFNSANASSLAGARATSYWYAVENNAAWWTRAFTGNDWGVNYENLTSHLGFGMLRDEDVYADRIFSSEIELMKLWCRIYQSNTAYNYSANIWKIEIFDKVFNEKSMGIATPAYEAPHMPSMPMGGFLGVIYSALMWIAEQLGPGAMQFWYLFVGFLDGTIGNWLGQPTFFSWFFTQIGLFFDYMVNSVAYFLSMVGEFFIFLGGTIGKFAGLVGTAFQTWGDMFTTGIRLLDTGLDSGINIWNDLGMSWWLLIGCIFYPIYLLSIWENDGIEALMAHIMFIVNIFAFLLNLLLRVAQFGINIIHYIIEAIPVVEAIVPLIPLTYLAITKGIPILIGAIG